MLPYLRALGIKYLRTGWTFKRLLSGLSQSQYWSQEKLEAYQDVKLRAMVRHCYRYVPYYRDVFKQLGLKPQDIQTRADLRHLPYLDKHAVREHFDALISRKWIKEFAFPGYTSGSTGTPGKFLRDYHFVNFENAAVWRHFQTHGYSDTKSMRRAVFTGRLIIPVEQKEPPFWFFNKLDNTLVFSSVHFSKANEQAYLDELLRFQPHIMAGYSSAIHMLAEALERDGRSLRLQAVFPGSETVYDYQREVIERVFQTHLFDWYGQQERVAAIGQCEHKTYHIIEDYSIVELVELDGQLEIVGTHLENYKMPLLRYRTGDSVIAGPIDCPCGRSFRTVERVQGRTGQYILTPDGRKITVINHLMQNFENIREAQFVQDRAGALTLNVVADGHFSEEARQGILRHSRAYISSDMDIKIQVVDAIPRTANGKFLSIVNHLEKAGLN